MDSATCLSLAVTHNPQEVLALTVLYGQRHVREIKSAIDVANHLDVIHRIISLPPDIFEGAQSSQIKTSNVAVPHGHYAAESMKATVVPNRNMLLLSTAVAVAISMGVEQVYYGAHAGDHAIYPDCRPEFFAAMEQAVALCDWHQVRLVAPFIHQTKTDIVNAGRALDTPFYLTYSCYEGAPIHCGLCGTCQERKEAFRDAGGIDPTEYQA
jgi:7-cyano-7-deazaguanine synthase